MRRPLADAAGSSLIHVAAQLRHAHTILLLSLVAPDLQVSQNANGEVPLAVAARCGHTSAIAALLLRRLQLELPPALSGRLLSLTLAD
ncbi:ankyrin repeat-containing protein [Chlorella sorokiniana]|uniref:Ankyrin repeat-containing protein n=1 Tax=Chlorella sorokiniana TaxID=3076 RepID=A0A2P6TP77_CHLSO|nr:ankyrin repeat-containing protein [Chlorella sorokiniana]|eukprot:PRW51132.1 ankyrin repeat-containing protein [Chlorella sorokiniana]